MKLKSGPQAVRLASRTAPAAVVLGAVIACLALTPACSRISNHFSGSSPTRKGTLSASPPAGPVGTTFSLTAGGFKPGEPMTFEIDPPKGARFIGPSHTAGPDGRVTTTYVPQAGNSPGTYHLKAVGSQGTRAQGQLTLEGAAPAKGKG